jgi:tetratricopeptide (TPR) repeat protein
VYSHLGEHFLTKRRYSDAAGAYETYVEKNPMSKEAPYFNMRAIEIYKEGGFPRLIIEAKKDFSKTYSVQSDYWTFYDINEQPDVQAFLKSNLIDLANHYHALYQNPKFVRKKEENYQEAIHWYREYLASFEKDEQAARLNNQLAGLLLENKNYFAAAHEYENTAYDYPVHDESASAGYAAVYAYREHLNIVNQSQRNDVKREIIRSSIKFSEHFPKNENAAIVLVAAVDDLYELEDYEPALIYGRQVIATYPGAEKKLLRSAWTVIAHASFDTNDYVEAEKAYIETLSLTDKADEKYQTLSENLAASVYKQGEQARDLGDHKLAAEHFLRVARVAPNSEIRPTAEYDAAAALIHLKEWATVSAVLEGFRLSYPTHELLPDITKKLAVVYKEDKQYEKAAKEFERIEKENPENESLRREALAEAAELYEKVNAKEKVLSVYQRMVEYFPKPIEDALEIRHKIAEIYLLRRDDARYISELNKIVSIDAAGGGGRTARTKFLAGNAALILAEPKLALFKEVALVQPFQQNLTVKKQRMRDAIDTYNRLVEYQVGNVTAAATYYIAEIYYEFNVALVKSERPTNLDEEELEEYELVIEEQAYPFEEKAIKVHEKNMELLDADIYNEWIDKSIARLAIMLPARYAKTEEASEPVMWIQPGQGGRDKRQDNDLKNKSTNDKAEVAK